MRLMAALNGALERQWRDTHKTPDGSGGGGGVLPEAERVAASTGRSVRMRSSTGSSCRSWTRSCHQPPVVRPRLYVSPFARAVAEPGDCRRPRRCCRAPRGWLLAAWVGNDSGDEWCRRIVHQLAGGTGVVVMRMQRIVMTPAGKALDIGRKTRVIPEQIRAALILRDGGCIYPMCEKPSAWTHGHHVQHWSRGETRVWTISPCSAPNIITRSTPTTSPSPSIRTANRASRWSAGSKTDPDSAGQVCPEREYPADQVDDLPGAVRAE